MSLYSYAQTETGLILAANLEGLYAPAADVFKGARATSVTVNPVGTLIQSSESLTGNGSYIFSNNSGLTYQFSASGQGGGTSDIAFEIVFKRNGTPTSDETLCRFTGISIFEDGASLRITTGGALRFGYASSSNSNNITTTANLCDNQWHHVVARYNNSTNGVRLYVDGTLVQTKTGVGNIGFGYAFSLGYSLSNSNVASNYFNGSIDYFAAYQSFAATDTATDSLVATHRAQFANNVPVPPTILPYQQQISNLGPKVWYKFNETAGTPVNSGSLTTNATFNNLLLNEQTDVDGRATYYNGTDSYININQWPAFSLFDDKSFTIETWFKLATQDANDRPIFSFGSFAIDQIRLLSLGSANANSGKLYLNIVSIGEASSADRDMYSTNTYFDNKWHHTVIAVNTTSIKWYIDGQLVHTKTLATGTLNIDSLSASPNTYRLIGASRSNTTGNIGSAPHKGWLDEFAIYDRELTGAEIITNYNSGSAVNLLDIPGTATALFVDPTRSVETVLVAAPMTANAASGDHYNSTVTFPTMLETYMAGRTLEAWYKFDTSQQLTNYGSLPTKVSIFEADAYTEAGTGIQGSGRLLTTGGSTGGVTNLSDNVGPLIADKDFSLGFWTKKATNEFANILSFYDTTGNDILKINWTANGYIQVDAYFNNSSDTITSSTDIANGNWHYVALRQSNNTLQLWVDGTSIGTATITHAYSNLDTLQFGNDGGTTTSEKLSISQFYVATAANITSTEIGNIYTAGTSAEVQASARMPEAKTRFNSAFNDYIVTKNPLIDLRLDEGTGAPLDYGSSGTIMVSQQSPQGYTQNNTGLNTRAFKFTDRIQAVRGNYSLASGTLSSASECTIGIVFKNANATNQQGLVGFGGRGGSQGTGFSLQQLASSGYLRIIAGNSNGTTNTFTGVTNVADNKWHLAIIVKNSNTIKLYIDGKQDLSSSSSNTLTDSGEFSIAAISGIDATTASRDTLIDEIFVTAGAFTAQEAFEAWQALRLEMDTTATASFPMPTNIAGTGNIETVDASTASSDFVMPTFSTDQILDAAPGTASALFVLPNYGGNVVIDANYGHTAATANAVFHEPQFQIGDFHSADHMDASALMVHPISTGGGTIAVPTAVGGPAIMVDPGIVTIKGARVFADPARANAILPLPPAYIQLSDDDWYVRLLNAHNDKKIEGVQQQLSSLANQSTTDIVKGGFLTFFDDVNLDITPTTTINTIASEIPAYFFDRPGSYRYDNNGNIIAPSTAKAAASASATRNSSNPTPLLSVGYFDDQERRAVRLDNIEFTLPGTDRYYSTRPYNIEFSFKTTKADQIITYGLWNSFLYNGRKIGVIGLFNGKIYLAEDNYVPFTASVSRAVGTQTAPHPKKFTETSKVGYLLGRKRIDDGQWHHVVIQQGWNDNRTQIWIDGQLDRQFGVQGELGGSNYFYDGLNGTNTIRPYIIGFNSNDPILRSDFQTSAWNFYPGRFIEERDLSLNYQAYSKWEPILAEPMTATINVGQNTAAKGNRPRAIMLYWWETDRNGNMQHRRFDGEGLYELDTDTFAQLATQYDQKGTVQKWYGWDIFPVDILGRYRSPMTKEEVLVSGGYRDPVTGAPRYLDIINDLDLTTIDAIFFRNYPDDSRELDEFARDEISDSYFNLKERTLYENFVKSVRSVMDTGISVYITNHQLALDLGIVDRVEIVNDLIDEDTAQWNPRGPILLPFTDGTNVTLEQGGASNFKGWYDTWRNNRLRVLNNVEGITTQAGIIRNDLAIYAPASEEWNKPYRSYASYTQKQSLNIGDTFVIASGTYTPVNNFGNSKPMSMQYYATHKNNVKVGIPVTGFANTYWKNDTEVENPYKDYVTSIALPEGTILNGRAIKSRVFVNFTERINSAFEEGSVELIQDEWIDLAYNVGRITATQRDTYKADAVNNLDRKLEAAIAAGNQAEITNINRLKYWDMNGMNLGATSFAVQGNISDQTANTGGGTQSSAPRSSSNRGTLAPENFSPTAGASWGGALWFKFEWFWKYPMMRIEVPSMLTRGFRWLSKRIEDDGIVNRTNASTAVADMIMPVVVGDKDRTVYAQPAFAGANLVHAPGYALTNVTNTSLPLFAEAKFGDFVKNIRADIMAAEARLRTNIVTTAVETDQVVLYIDHVDPILYIREDIIK